jgi:hypothetical protein
MPDKIVGEDNDPNGWGSIVVGEFQPDGSILIVSERRFRCKIDAEAIIKDLAKPEIRLDPPKRS